MENWKVGDRVKVVSHTYLDDVATITEITKAGNVRIDSDRRLYDKWGNLRGGNVWGCERIIKISEEEFEQLSQLRRLNKKVDKIIQRLHEIIKMRRDGELLKYGGAINEFYTTIYEGSE